VISVVPDPSVLVAAFLSRGGEGASAELIRLWIDGGLAFVVSPHLVHELRSVLLRPEFRRTATAEQVLAYVAFIQDYGILQEDVPSPDSVSRDQTDDYWLALARAAHADFIISFDKDLLELEGQDLPILRPGELLWRMRAS